MKVDGIADMPNYKYVDERFRNPSWDPEQAYSTPIKWVQPHLLIGQTAMTAMAHL